MNNNNDILEVYVDYIDNDGYVLRYNYENKHYYNTGICLKGNRGPGGPPGRPGKDGITPRIGDNGHWYIGDIDTGVSAVGTDGNPVDGGILTEGVYDISEHNPTGGPNNDGKFTLEYVLNNADTLIPTAVRHGGMSIKFIQSSDNKYVQYRLMADSWSTNVSDWAICSDEILTENPEFIKVYTDKNNKLLWAIKTDGTIYYGAGVPPQVIEYIQQKIDELSLDEYEDIVAFLDGLEEGENTLQQLLDEKVDKMEGKGLSTNDFTNDEKEVVGRSTLIESEEYIQVETDNERKILGGRRLDGTKFENSDFEVKGKASVGGLSVNEVDITDNVDAINSTKYIEHNNWVDVKTDENDKIIEAINPDGEKHISKFDNETEEMIKGFVGSSDPVSSVINIPLLDANFTSPVPYKVYNGDIEDETIKGQGTAKYVFDVPLSEESFNIRCKVRITENLLNQMKSATMLRLGNAYIDAVPTALTQYSSYETYDGSSHLMLWNDFKGGIKYNDGDGDTGTNKLAIGQYAFYVQYVGSENTASVENDGSKFILKIGSTTHEFAYSTYETVASLYEAIKAIPDIVVAYKELEGRMSNELAIFPECQIKTTCYTKTDRGLGSGDVQEYVDAYQFYIPYAVDDLWHQVEIVKLGNVVHCSFDGILKKFQYNSLSDYSHLVLGDGNSMYFKDLSIDLSSPNDAEYWSNGDRLVSSANPAIIITEGHGMWDGPVCESSAAISSRITDELATSTDRLYYVFERMRSMGYVPVSIQDVADYYARNKQLPKRCFTSVFDGERWGDWLETKDKKAFAELGVCPTIAAVTGATGDVTYNVYGGTKTVTVKEAAELCLKNNFRIVSHTRDHWKIDCVRISTLLDELTQDIESADNCLADGMILVYPGGKKTRAVFAALKWLGYRIGISIATAADNYANNTLSRNKYNLNRVEIGFRTSLTTILNKII